MRAYTKTVFRTVGNNFGRFFAIAAIIILGIGFVAGLGSVSPRILNSVSTYLQEVNAADLVIKSTDGDGFTKAQLDEIADNETTAALCALTSMDLQVADVNARFYIMPLSNAAVSGVKLLHGRLPQTGTEILIERPSQYVEQREIGDQFNLFGYQMTVVGVCENPLIFSKTGEPDVNDGNNLQLIAYADAQLFQLPFPLSATDVYVKVANTDGLNVFSDEYKQSVKSAAERLAALDCFASAEHKPVFLTLEENVSCASIVGYTDKVNVISLIFPVFFIAVAALVVLTTMTRLIEEERAVIACYRTLGYSNGRIALKYISFSVICCLVGSIVGILFGILLLPAVIYPAFGGLFFMPTSVWTVSLMPGIIASLAMLATVVGVTAYLILKELRARPAALLKPKAPRAGRKILLERIPFIWNRMKFRYKSTYRNIFRYVKHLVMTVVSVAGSTALVLAGFGLYDISKAAGITESAGMSETFSMISVVVIIFAAFLCVLVIYNLTNMNIGERTREIATLKVLGYRRGEVASYIYREIFIMALFGIVVGIPLGYGLLHFVFAYLEFGSVTDVKWYSYLLAAALTVLFIGLVDLMLYRKIQHIDMTGSLKTVE